MKQQFWILNSALLVLLLAVVFVSRTIWQEAPTIRMPRSHEAKTAARDKILIIPFSQIYGRRDIFNTQSAETKTAKKTFAKAAPQLTLPQAPKAPERQKIEFIDPLNISLNGIILSADEENSICIIADETGKEKTYRTSDRIQDGTIIKISRHSAVFLRANGQQETFFLHGSEPGFGRPSSQTLLFNKREGNVFSIDPLRLQNEITSLGQFLEEIDLIPVYHKGKCIGMKIGTAQSQSLISQMGLKSNDIVKSINNIDITNVAERTKIYDEVRMATYGDTVQVGIERANSNLTLKYQLERPKAEIKFDGDKQQGTQPPTDVAQVQQSGPTLNKKQFTEGKSTSRKTRNKEFKRRHSKQYGENIATIRKRLLDNMKSRSNRPRVR